MPRRVWPQFVFDFLISSYLWEGNFVTLSFGCPYSSKRNTTTRHLWMILESQPVDDSCTIWSNTWLTSTHFKVMRSNRLNPHSWRWMDAWERLTMADRHVNVNLQFWSQGAQGIISYLMIMRLTCTRISSEITQHSQTVHVSCCSLERTCQRCLAFSDSKASKLIVTNLSFDARS